MFADKAKEFLAQKNIAVVGVSRTEKDAANGIYTALRGKGYHVFAVNPKADTVEGDKCYHNLKEIPEKLDAVMIVTRPEVAVEVVHECAEVGVPRVWMHKNALFGEARSSVSEEAVAYCKEHDISVIDGGCPMMFMDFPHKCMRWMLGVMGKLPN